jgi:hypothetical protein
MKTFQHILLLAGLAIAPLGLFAGPASTGQTVIPGGSFTTAYVINQPGSYILGGNRLVTDATKTIIQITAPDVTLDLGGFSLSHPGGSNNAGFGIHLTAPENVEIRNGSIVNAAKYGIYAALGKGLRVVDVRIVSARSIGILNYADSSLIDRCAVADSEVVGIYGKGTGLLVTDCVISDCGMGAGLDSGRIVRTVVTGCRVGMTLASTAAVDCSVTGAIQVGFLTKAKSTLRNVESMGNAVGVFSTDASTVIFGSRITNSTTIVTQGPYINGGGNVIQYSALILQISYRRGLLFGAGRSR